MPREAKKLLKLLCLLALISVGVWYYFGLAKAAPPSLAEIAYLDVGQGDSELITLPPDYQILIDGGPGDQVIDQLNVEMPLGDRTIELMVNSHPDADHLAGLLSVLREYEVKQILMPDVAKDTLMYKEWMQLIESKHIPYQRLREPATIPLRDEVRIDILHPSTQTMLPNMAANDWSVIMRLQVGQTSFLFTGDIEGGVEEAVVEHETPALASDVLKVAHHGSHTSSTEAFLQAVQPTLAIMEVGRDNRYGHPHADVLQRYAQLHIPVLRTDQEGTIVLSSDGTTISREKPVFAALPFVGKKYEKVYTFQQR